MGERGKGKTWMGGTFSRLVACRLSSFRQIRPTLYIHLITLQRLHFLRAAIKKVINLKFTNKITFSIKFRKISTDFFKHPMQY